MPKLKYLDDRDAWMLAEHFPNVDFFFSQIWLSSFVNELENSCGKNYKKVLAVFQPKFYIRFYYGQKDSLAFERYLVKKMKKDTQFGFKINRKIINLSDKLREFSQKLNKQNLKKLNNREIWKLLEKQDDIHTCLYEWGWLSNATDMFHASFTSELKNYLAGQSAKYGKDKDLNKIFNILTSPDKKSVAAEEAENLLKIADLMLKKPRGTKLIDKKLGEHYNKYFYLKYLWIGTHGIYSKKHYLKTAKELTRDKISPAKKLVAARRELAKIKREKQKLFRELKINKKYKDLFCIYSDFMLTKIYRRYAQIYWAYEMSGLLKEIGQRLNLNLDEVRYMLPIELKESLLEGKLNRQEIKKRLNFCWYYVEKGVEIISTNKQHRILKQLKSESQKDVKKLVGQVACLGKVRGEVKIINSSKEINKMKQGNILVSIATNPDLLPAMKRAAAIVTEQGGVTSHAAIVSRELKIPCIIGTKIATRVLKDGDRVEVDAERGVVRKI